MKKTIIDLFEESVSKYSNNTFLLEKVHSEYEPTTYFQTKEAAVTFGAGLHILGLKKGDNVSILSEGRNLWVIGELAIFYAGGINVPLSIKLEESNDLLFRLIHADVSILMISARQLPKIRLIKDKLPLLKHIVLFDKIDNFENGEIYYEEICKMGEDFLKENRTAFLEISKSIQNDDYATITYTSGTTADPKGVVLTHRNYTANVEQSLTCMTIPPHWRMLIILPLDHCFAHVVGFYIMIASGASVATVQVGKTGLDTLKNIPINIKEIKPHILLSVPALAKNFKKNIETSVKAKGKVVESIFNFGLKCSYIYNKDGWNKGSGFSFLLYPIVSVIKQVIFKKVSMAMGGELQFFVGGGALLDKELQKFFYALGIPMYQGYGLSEATPVISTNTPAKHRLGSSGILVKPLEIKILDNDGIEQPFNRQGEIVIKGENVMAGYWKNPKASAESIKDGWLFTGDLGYMTKEGFLYVQGRFKSLLISSDGEKYSPEEIEEMLVSQSKIIQQIMLHNNQNPYTIAVIVADNPNKLSRKELLQEISNEIEKYKGKGIYAGMFPERWLPATFILAKEPFTEQNKMINSTMKMVRSKVEEAYKEQIEAAYSAEGKNIFNKFNLEQND
jgi:long-chain acyl-CoA synthetase